MFFKFLICSFKLLIWDSKFSFSELKLVICSFKLVSFLLSSFSFSINFSFYCLVELIKLSNSLFWIVKLAILFWFSELVLISNFNLLSFSELLLINVCNKLVCFSNCFVLLSNSSCFDLISSDNLINSDKTFWFFLFNSFKLFVSKELLWVICLIEFWLFNKTLVSLSIESLLFWLSLVSLAIVLIVWLFLVFRSSNFWLLSLICFSKLLIYWDFCLVEFLASLSLFTNWSNCSNNLFFSAWISEINWFVFLIKALLSMI
ncbi:hypothetical protein V2P57_01435 [Mycoplasma mycoides subsp. mycoides]